MTDISQAMADAPGGVFQAPQLDPAKKLLGYACSFITFSPNYQNMEPLARLVARMPWQSPAS